MLERELTGNPAGYVGTENTVQNGENCVPLRSAEAFDTYCRSVQSQLAEHAQKRRHFLQNAHSRLTQMLHAAKAVEDNTLYQELWQIRTAARELLNALPTVNSTPDVPTAPLGSLPSVPSAGLSSPSNGHSASHYERPFAPRPEPSEGSPFAAVSSQPYSDSLPRLPRRPMRPVGDIEADAKSLREQLTDWNDKWPLLTEAGTLHAPHCLRLRAMACRQRRLEEEAGDNEVADIEELCEEIIALLDAADDQEYTVAFDEEISPPPTAYQWGELADRYEEMAKAQEAFDWWNAHYNELTLAEIQPVAEAVAAVQQRFNRLLFRIGARDPFQQALFDNLRSWAKEAQCYLHSLRPKVPIAELIERASTLDAAFATACESLAAKTQE